MTYGGRDLGSAFRTVRKNTLIVAEDIPEGKYGYRAAPDLRSVGELLTHISNISSMAAQMRKRANVMGAHLTTASLRPEGCSAPRSEICQATARFLGNCRLTADATSSMALVTGSTGSTSLSGFLQAFASDLKDASTVGGVLNTQA